VRNPKCGETEEIIIRALLNIDNEGSGADIQREIARVLGRGFTPGNFYGTVDSLIDKGLIEVKQYESPSPKTGNRSVRILEVSPRGKEAVVAKERMRRSFEASYSFFRSGGFPSET